MLRYHVPILSFDTRSETLRQTPTEQWSDEAKAAHEERVERLRQQISHEFGGLNLDMKVRNFADIGQLPWSIRAHHNEFLAQARDAFVMGQYYPALTAACALGERMLNHMIIDLKGHYDTQEPELRTGQPIQNWQRMIHILDRWGALAPTATQAFRRLYGLRNRSIHFNRDTVERQRSDAQRALQLVKTIVNAQFASFGRDCPWIDFDGFRFFVKKEFESHPFVLAYYSRACPRLGPKYHYNLVGHLWLATDLNDYPPTEIDDEEYKRLKQEHLGQPRDEAVRHHLTDNLATTYTWVDGQYFVATRVVGLPEGMGGGPAIELRDPFHDHDRNPEPYVDIRFVPIPEDCVAEVAAEPQ